MKASNISTKARLIAFLVIAAVVIVIGAFIVPKVMAFGDAIAPATDFPAKVSEAKAAGVDFCVAYEPYKVYQQNLFVLDTDDGRRFVMEAGIIYPQETVAYKSGAVSPVMIGNCFSDHGAVFLDVHGKKEGTDEHLDFAMIVGREVDPLTSTPTE